MFEESLEIAGLVPLKHTYKIFEPQGVTMLYVLDHGHLSKFIKKEKTKFIKKKKILKYFSKN
jgi:hypothetical protein